MLLLGLFAYFGAPILIFGALEQFELSLPVHGGVGLALWGLVAWGATKVKFEMETDHRGYYPGPR